MGLERTSLDVQQTIRIGKITLARLTGNKRQEAFNMGVHPSTIGRWLDVGTLDHNMPWQLLPLHSAADHLIGMMAEDRGQALVQMIDVAALNGDVEDERDRILVALGKATARLMEFHEKRRNRKDKSVRATHISKHEAERLLPVVEELVRAGVTMRAELHALVQGEG